MQNFVIVVFAGIIVFLTIFRLNMSLSTSAFLKRLKDIWLFAKKDNFGHHMLLSSLDFKYFDKNQGICTEYKVPDALCLVDEHGKKYLSCGAALSLFDEISSLGLVAEDRTHRPGVTVNLSVNMLKFSAGPGDVISVQSKALKIGTTIGYLDMKMYLNSECIAVGHHVKFLPMGQAWDILMSPLLRPLTIRFAEYAERNNGLKLPPSAYDDKNMNLKLLFGAMNTVIPTIANQLGNLHGGAAGIICELQALKQEEDKRKKVHQINVSCMAPSKEELSFNVQKMDENVYSVQIMSRGKNTVQASVSLK